MAGLFFRRILALMSALGVTYAFQILGLRTSHQAVYLSLSHSRNNIFVSRQASVHRCAKLTMMGDIATQDDLINKMVDLAPLDLSMLISQNLKEVSQPSLFLRIAEMSDQTDNDVRKTKLAALADNLVSTLHVIVKRTEEQMDSASKLIQEIVAQAAEPNGEFLVPLNAQRVSAMRNKVTNNLNEMDESLLSTVMAYMKKANEDGLQGMVTILQKVLQMWAASDLLAAGVASPAVVQLLQADADEWDSLLVASEADREGLVAAVQSCVERAVLQKPSGSNAQRIQAEFLRELMARIRKGQAPPAGF